MPSFAFTTLMGLADPSPPALLPTGVSYNVPAININRNPSVFIHPLWIMATTTSHHWVGRLQRKEFHENSSFYYGTQRNSMNFTSKGTGIDSSRRRGLHHEQTLGLIHASTSQSSLADPVQQKSSKSGNNSLKKSNEVALVLIRHGESLWNERNLFTGCVDVPLSEKGIEEAIDAGRRISNIPIDMIYTSALIRAQMTAMLAMTQHRHKLVPVIMHDESEQAKVWGEMYSAKTRMQSIPVMTAWQLNERMYGELQGLNKQETADRFGKEQVHIWRRSYDIPPPNGESLEMCAERAVSYFKEQIQPQLLNGKNVMISAHGNSLRSIIMYLDHLTSQEVISLELSTGIPMLYIFKEGKFIRRGSPVSPTETGVYAYTRGLALYRQRLDEMLP